MRGLGWNPKQVWAAARRSMPEQQKRKKEKARVSEQATKSARVGNGMFRSLQGKDHLRPVTMQQKNIRKRGIPISSGMPR